MIDTTTDNRYMLLVEPGQRPLVIIPVTMLDQALALLDANKLPYWVNEEYLSADGKPEVAFIKVDRRDADPALIKRLLNSIP